MAGLEHWLPSHEAFTGTFALLLWAAGVVTALIIVLGVTTFRDFGTRGAADVLVRGAAVLIFAVLAWTWLNTSAEREQALERRALDARLTELTARAIGSGSALSCLDAVGNEAVASACAQALFATPQAVAGAVAYIDAKLTLLAEGLDYAGRDRNYAGHMEGLRRSLEADRFGIVAHVLAGRGCTAEDCPAFKLLRDVSRVRENLRDRYFEAYVVHHSANWRTDGQPVATGGATSAVPTTTSTISQGAGVASKYNFPSAASIPPVSIMNAEPQVAVPPEAAAQPPTQPAAPRRQARPPARQQASPPSPSPPPATVANPGPPRP